MHKMTLWYLVTNCNNLYFYQLPTCNKTPTMLSTMRHENSMYTEEAEIVELYPFHEKIEKTAIQSDMIGCGLDF